MTDKLLCPLCQQELRKIHPTYIICDNCRIVGDKELWQALIDTKKKLDRYEKVLEKIAKDRKIISMTGYSFDNEIYVNAAREALGMPLDIPEYDDDV